MPEIITAEVAFSKWADLVETKSTPTNINIYPIRNVAAFKPEAVISRTGSTVLQPFKGEMHLFTIAGLSGRHVKPFEFRFICLILSEIIQLPV
jgi:hypothetical protein